MPILSNLIRDVLFDTSDRCCLCFNAIRENETTFFNIVDEVSMGNDIETNKVLHEIINTVLGDKVSDSIAAHNIICQKCTGMVINCYKFIKQCRQNIEQLQCTIDSLLKHTQKSAGNYDYKSLFVALDTSNYNVELYYDKHRNCNDHTLLHKRFQRLYKDTQQVIIDFELESNYSNEKCVVKRIRRSIWQSLVLADIVHDKDDLKNLKCKVCLKLFPTDIKIKQHYIRLHAPKDFKCSQCPKAFGSSLLLKQHTKDSHCTAVCSQCGKTYTNIFSLRHHELHYHSLQRLICQTCGKAYKGKNTFNNHIIKKLCKTMRKSNAEAEHCCDYCGKKYGQKSALRVHIRVEHLNQGEVWTCDWCGKKLSCISRLNDHIITHTKHKNFECQLCGGKFVTKTSLLYHTRTHTGEKPYKCDFCDMTFLSASRRSEHVKRHHTQSSLECDICHGKFKGDKSLAQHRKRHFDVKSKLYFVPQAKK